MVVLLQTLNKNPGGGVPVRGEVLAGRLRLLACWRILGTMQSEEKSTKGIERTTMFAKRVCDYCTKWAIDMENSKTTVYV